MAGVNVALTSLLKSGDHIVAAAAIFGNSLHIIKSILPNFGIEYTLVDVDDNDAWAIRNTQCESR